MDKAEIRNRLDAVAAQAAAAGFTIDWAKFIQAIMLLIEAFKPTPTPGPVVVASAEYAAEVLFAQVDAGKINWAKLFEFIEKILPLILPIFI